MAERNIVRYMQVEKEVDSPKGMDGSEGTELGDRRGIDDPGRARCKAGAPACDNG